MKKLAAKLTIVLTISFFMGFSTSINAEVDQEREIKIEKSYISQEKGLKPVTWISFSVQETGSYIIDINDNGNDQRTLWNADKSKKLDTVTNKNQSIVHTLIEGERYYLEIQSSKEKAFLNKCAAIKVKKLSLPTDEHFLEQWGIFNSYNGIDINVVPAWKYSKGANINIGILDTGTDCIHSDLVGNKGLKKGYNFVHNMSDVFPKNEEYNSFAAAVGHGTMVAGIIGANTDNKIGISGIASESEIIPLKILGEPIAGNDNYDDTVETFVSAIQYAKDHNVKIINCSFGGSAPDIAEKAAIEAVEEDILFVVAAGNKGNDLAKVPIYPACYGLDNMIIVGAVDCRGKLVQNSNYGGPTDIVAPGDEIMSTYPGNQYMYSTGTSMAAAFVSGAGALTWSNNPYLTPQEVRRILVAGENVTPLGIDKNKVASQGMLNAYKAVVASKQVPAEKYKRKACAENNKGTIEYYKNRVNDSEKTNTIIVKFKHENYDKQLIQRIKQKHEFKQLEMKKHLELIDAYVIVLENIREADRAISVLNKEQCIEYAEPNYIRR